MFSFLRSAVGKRRSQAKDLSAHAEKVVRYRSDVLPASALAEIAGARAALSAAVATGDGFAEAVDTLDALLRRHGGSIYPVGAVADWVETFVIAAILAGGVRVYVFQPFKIPTNSMYPTYHGMTAHAYAEGEPSPTAATRALRKVTLGATHLAPAAPVDGEVLVPVRVGYSGHCASAEPAHTVDDGILGTGLLRGAAEAYPLLVGGREVAVTVPADFTFHAAWAGAYFPKEWAEPVPEQERLRRIYAGALARGDVLPGARPGYALLRTRRVVKAGEPVIRFDILTGDMVVVDRMSYHFTRPRVGDAFVFDTGLVPAMSPRDDFYIKRLVGLPGDTLQVRAGKLWRNGAVAAGNAGFDGNNGGHAQREYFGYTADIGGPNPIDEPRLLGPREYWAMGDNSGNSRDSRDFGAVPEPALVGRALFILHPFTDRWGAAR